MLVRKKRLSINGIGWIEMSKWFDDGDYMTTIYDNKKKERVIARISIKKGTINESEFKSRKHAKTNHKRGA